MKRYTGQKALYEAISRSRAKAKQHSILEKLRSGSLKSETPGHHEPESTVESEGVSDQASEPVVEEMAEPQVVETQPDLAIELPVQEEPVPQAEPEPLAEESPLPTARPEPILMPRPVERVTPHVVSPSPVQKWLKPRPVQLNEGRIEVSVPYYVGAIAGIVLLMVALIAYRLGQARAGSPADAVARSAQVGGNAPNSKMNPPTGTPSNEPTTTAGQSPANPTPTGVVRQDSSPTAPIGDNWIVLARYKTSRDLEPVVKHFANYGIDLFILPLDDAPAIFAQFGLNASKLPTGSGFLLVTKNAYDNPNVSGSEGNKMLKRIAEVGAQYKAQSGFESFAPHYFDDAYGMKIR